MSRFLFGACLVATMLAGAFGLQARLRNDMPTEMSRALVDPRPSQVMADWYEKHWHRDDGLVLYAGQETERAASYLFIMRHVPTMLCMWHRESQFRAIAGDDGKSWGITQIVRRREAHWRRFWLNRGIELGSLDDPTTQIFFGVAEFQEHLDLARGNEWEAVRRYNGSGPSARRYARRVFLTRQRVFGIHPPKRKP